MQCERHRSVILVFKTQVIVCRADILLEFVVKSIRSRKQLEDYMSVKGLPSVTTGCPANNELSTSQALDTRPDASVSGPATPQNASPRMDIV